MIALFAAAPMAPAVAAGALDPPQPIVYVVRSGDTLSAIAARFSVTPQRLAEANNLMGRQIYPGQILRIPAILGPRGQLIPIDPTPGLTCNPRAMVLVQAGDTLAELSQRWSVAAEELRADNELSSDRLWVGQVLRIACADDPGQAAAGTPSPGARGGPCADPYTVRPGDTLQRIASRCGSSVAVLKEANGMVSNVLMVGQALAMPTPSR
jgi:LysM repeat protein